MCRADLNEILSCTETELTSTEETISETLRNGGSCVQSNRSNVLQFDNNTKMFVKIFDSTGNVFKLEVKCHDKEIFNLLSCLSNLQR